MVYIKSDAVARHFDEIAEEYDFYKKKNSFYYGNLKRLLHLFIPKDQKVLEVGCGTGNLLTSTNPKFGYGTDLSSEMIKIAKSKHKDDRNLTFSTLWPEGKFRYVFMSDVVEHLEKPESVFKKISNRMDSQSIFINTMANPLWELLLMAAEGLGLKMPEGKHRRIKYAQINKLLRNVGLKVIKHDYKLLIPIRIPFFTEFANKHLERHLKKLAFIEYLIAVKM